MQIRGTYYTIIMKTSEFCCVLIQCMTLNSITHHLGDTTCGFELISSASPWSNRVGITLIFIIPFLKEDRDEKPEITDSFSYKAANETQKPFDSKMSNLTQHPPV